LSWPGDVEDPECDGPDEREAGIDSTQCEPVIKDTADGLEAYWDGESQPDDTCDYDETEKYSSWLSSPGGPPRAFTCYDGDRAETDLPLFRSTQEFDYCGQVTRYLSNLDKHHAAKYAPTKEEVRNAIGRGRFVDEDGWKPKFQWLLAAEATYDGGSSDVICRDCLYQDTWNEVGDRDLQDANSSYRPDPKDLANRDDAWIPANPRDENSGVGDSSFEGGWAGNCDIGQQWQKRGGVAGLEWTCSGSLKWPQEVYFPSTTHQGDEARVGFYVMPNNFNKQPDSGTSYRDALANTEEYSSAGDAPRLDVLHAVCWKGKVSDKSSSLAGDRGSDWFSVKYEGLSGTVNHPVPVFGELEVKSSTRYSCQWKYVDGEGNEITDQGNVRNLTKDEFETSISDVSLPDGVSGVTEVSNVKNRNLDNFLSDWRTGSASSFDSSASKPSFS